MKPSSVLGIPSLCIFISLIAGNSHQAEIYKERFRWSPQSPIAYDLQSLTPQQREEINKNGDYKQPDNTIIRGMQFWKGEKLFISTTLKTDYFNNNVTLPLVLGQIDVGAQTPNTKSPPIIPYAADQLMNQTKSISPIVIDECDRLWFVDYAQLRLFVINLNDGKKIREVTLLNTPAATTFATISVDVSSNSDCDNTHAYVPHPDRFEIVVYRFNDSAQWVVSKPNITINELFVSDMWENMVASMIKEGAFNLSLMDTALSEAKDSTGDKILYGVAQKASVIFSVSTKILQNPAAKSPQFTALGLLGDISPGTLYYHKQTGILFYYRLVGDGVGCWNTRRNPREVTSATTDMPIKLYTTFDLDLSVFLVTGDTQNNLWFGETRQLPQNDTIPGNNDGSKLYSTGLFSAPIDDLVKKTKCAPSQ